MIICCKNIHHAQKLWKQAHNKNVKPRNYGLGNKVWFNGKYIKTKQNWKLEAKFLRPFWVLHPISKEAYKLKLLKKWKIYNVFYLSLLEQDIIKRRLVERMPALDASNEDNK